MKKKIIKFKLFNQNSLIEFSTSGGKRGTLISGAVSSVAHYSRNYKIICETD